MYEIVSSSYRITPLRGLTITRIFAAWSTWLTSFLPPDVGQWGKTAAELEGSGSAQKQTTVYCFSMVSL